MKPTSKFKEWAPWQKSARRKRKKTKMAKRAKRTGTKSVMLFKRSLKKKRNKNEGRGMFEVRLF